MEILVGGGFGVLCRGVFHVEAKEKDWAGNLSVPQSQWVQAVGGFDLGLPGFK
jgi:hypothetical protein